MARRLFLDDRNVAEATDLELIAHPAIKHPSNPIIRQEHPWESSRAQIGGQSVVYDAAARRFRMYYGATAGPRWPSVRINSREMPGHSTLISYAESDDGIAWHKPHLGQRTFNDTQDTNLLDIFVGQSGERAGVLVDEHDPDASRRYKMLAWDQRALLLPDGELVHAGERVFVRDPSGAVVGEETYSERGNNWGVEYAYSADGVAWTRHTPGPVIRCYNDTGSSLLWDPHLRRYVGFGRFNKGGTFTTTDVTYSSRTGQAYNVGRAVSRVESDDLLHWSEPELVLTADRFDPESLQIDAMPVTFYEGLYLGAIESDRRPFPASAQPIQLGVSTDGRTWHRVASRAPFVPVGDPGSWDDAAVRPGSGPLLAGDHVHLYYSGVSRRGDFQIGLAQWRRDGFVSYRATSSGGELLTRPFILEGGELYLNLDAGGGHAHVQVCDAQGRPFLGWSARFAGLTDNTINPQINAADRPDQAWGVSEWSLPVGGDQLQARVRWARDDLRSRIGKPISLRIRLVDADLFSFWAKD